MSLLFIFFRLQMFHLSWVFPTQRQKRKDLQRKMFKIISWKNNIRIKIKRPSICSCSWLLKKGQGIWGI